MLTHSGLEPESTDSTNNRVASVSEQYQLICMIIANFGGIYSIKTNSDPFLIVGKASTNILVYNSLKKKDKRSFFFTKIWGSLVHPIAMSLGWV